MYDYSLRCDCDFECCEPTLHEAKLCARIHQHACNGTVYIDQQELGGDMTDKYWKIKGKATAAKQ